MTVWAQPSQRPTCPPSAAVRQRSMADITFIWLDTDVTDVGTPPRRSVVAEDIRDLQGWTGHGADYAGSWSFRFFLGFLRGRASRSSGLSIRAIMPVATRV